jgi:RimJ/RimL family protein N-acetyltransferase
MDHDLHIAGHYFALRPVRVGDAALIVELRSDPSRTRYLQPIATEVAAQEAFIREYLMRPDDYYFVVEDRGTHWAEGLVGLYGFDGAGRAEAGRWVLRPGSLAAVESAWLLYRIAFERLGLKEVVCLTLAENTHVLSFHDSSGLERRGVRPRDVQIGEAWYDRVEHVLTCERWPTIGEKLSRLAQCVK